uniref:Uncharacterized protein n=1 Tax=Ditylenchus dipsaci TaxID=166011 RepID=A0A915DV82_9BILA
MILGLRFTVQLSKGPLTVTLIEIGKDTLVTGLGQVIWIGICNDKDKSWVTRRSQHTTHFLRHSPHIYSVILTQDAHAEDIKNGEYLTMIAEDLHLRMIPTTTVNLLHLENNEYPP